MCTELYRGQALQQASTPALIPHEVIVPQSLSFSNHLNNEQLALWLQNHPRLIGNDITFVINHQATEIQVPSFFPPGMLPTGMTHTFI